jgi:hypothetical protein
MAFPASVQPGDSAVGAIATQHVAGFAILALVRDMAEIDWLSLLRIEQIRKNDPADDQGADKAQQKENHPQCLVSGRSTFLLIHRTASVFP